MITLKKSWIRIIINFVIHKLMKEHREDEFGMLSIKNLKRR